jgi:TetR/AcrR family transcriptional regulator, transcriptional repressor of aconitase
MPKTITKPGKRLTREESRAQTRATLIAVGREHFLRYGLGGAVAEKIAEDAGYSGAERSTPISTARRSFSLL